jgi:hypothetical protein
MKTETTETRNGEGAQLPRKGPAAADFAELKSMLHEVASEMADLKQSVGGSLTNVMADWVAAQYLLAARKQLAALPEGPERVELLRQATRDVVALQRGGNWDHRLQLDREKLEFERQKHRDALEAAKPKPQNYRDPKLPLSDEDRRAIVDKVDEIMGLK